MRVIPLISPLPFEIIDYANAFPILVNLADNQNPHKGVIVKMTSSGSEHNCSLSVSVICDSNRVLVREISLNLSLQTFLFYYINLLELLIPDLHPLTSFIILFLRGHTHWRN